MLRSATATRFLPLVEMTKFDEFNIQTQHKLLSPAINQPF